MVSYAPVEHHSNHNITQENITMPKEQDRHTGKRENVWFPFEENQEMLEAMQIVGMENKSEFIRSAVRSFSKAIKERKGI